MLKTWLPEREGAEQGHVLVWQGAKPGRATGAQAERASFPAQGVRHSLPPGTTAMESLPAPHLPASEGEFQGLTMPRPCPPAASLIKATTAVLSILSLWALPSDSPWLPAAGSTGVQAGLALNSRLHIGLGSQRVGLGTLLQADPGTPQVDCTFSYLEVQAMALQETPPQVRCLLSTPPGPLAWHSSPPPLAPTYGAQPSHLPSPGHL